MTDKDKLKNQEEPVNNDFEMALAEMISKAQTSVIDPLVIAAQWKDELIKLAKGKEPVSEDLEKAAEMFIDTLIPTEVDTVTPFAAEYVIGLLNKAIEFGANWQKQQLMANAVDVTIAIPYQNGYGGCTQLVDSKEGLPFGEKLKVLAIKEE